MVHTRRLLPWSVQNMRELGGYITADGKAVTQWGRFIRSSVPMELTESDIAFLRDYGVKTVIDMRWFDETLSWPCPLQGADGFDYRNIPFTDDKSILTDTMYCPLDHLVPVAQGAHRTREILSAMAQSDGASLFFCFAGKDRTGMIAALLLLAANVPLEDIVADYQVTYTYIKGVLAKNFPATDTGMAEDKNKPVRPERLRRTEPEWIMPYIHHVLRHGSIDAYFEEIGLNAREVETLRRKLTAN